MWYDTLCAFFRLSPFRLTDQKSILIHLIIPIKETHMLDIILDVITIILSLVTIVIVRKIWREKK